MSRQNQVHYRPGSPYPWRSFQDGIVPKTASGYCWFRPQLPLGAMSFQEERALVPTTLLQLASLVQGQLDGDGGQVIAAARPVQEAVPGEISFIENDHHLRAVKDCKAAALVVPLALADKVRLLLANRPMPLALLLVKDALSAFITIAQHLHPEVPQSLQGIDPLACVHPSVTLGPEASVHAFASVGAGSTLGARCRIHSGVVIGRNCQIGADVTLYPNVVLYDNTVIGQRTIIHANAVIGADGFGYRLQGGSHVKVPQLGWVEIGDDVEIGACSTIDRGTFQPTRIGSGTKIDNLVMVGHNCQVGPHNLFVSQVGIAGSCTTGRYVVMAGQVGVADHLHFGDGSQVGARSGVMRDVPAGERVLGTPARSERDEKRILLSLEHLPELIKEIKRLKRHLGLTDETRKESGAA